MQGNLFKKFIISTTFPWLNVVRMYGTSQLFIYLFCLKTEAELQELIREVEENPAPADAPQPPSPKSADTETPGKRCMSDDCLSKFHWTASHATFPWLVSQLIS